MKKRKLVFSLVIVILFVGVWFALTIPTVHFSRTPRELMRTFEHAIDSNNKKEAYALFSTDRSYHAFLNLGDEYDSSKWSKYPLVKRKGESTMDAWRKWFKKYGLSKLKYPIAPEGGVYCTTVDNMNFNIHIEYIDQGYLITDWSYMLDD